MENHYFEWVNQLQMAIFNSYVNVYQRLSIEDSPAGNGDFVAVEPQKNTTSAGCNDGAVHNMELNTDSGYPLVMSK